MNTEQAIKQLEASIRNETDLIDACCGDKSKLERERFYLSALRAQQERENPKPLTLDELKERDGKPVFAIDGEGHRCWVVVNALDGECADNEFGTWQMCFYNMTCADGDLHNMGWIAYDHEPKEAKP